MRHLKHKNQLGRKKEHRQAMMSNLTAALLTHGRIQTTLPKAKALRPFVERIITLAKRAHGASPERTLHFRRLAQSRVRDRAAVGLLFNERVQEFLSRDGGYTRIYKLGTRIGDAAEMAVIQLIPADDEGYTSRRQKSSPKKKAESAAVEETTAPVVEEPAAAVAGEVESSAEETSTAATEETPAATTEETIAEDTTSLGEEKKD